MTVGGSKEILWTEDNSVAYVLDVRKDGSVSFQIRKGTLRAIVEQIVVWLVRPPGSSKSSIQDVESQLQCFLCAHERVVSTTELLAMLHEISQNAGDVWQEGVFKFITFWLSTSYYPDFVSFRYSPSSIVVKRFRKESHFFSATVDK